MNRFVISLGDFASAMGSVTRTYSRGLLSIAVLIGLILPSLVLLHALDSLKAAARDRSIEAVTDLLQDDLKLADCTFDARTQLGMMIRRFQMEHPPRMAPASGSRQDLVNNARKIFHLVRQMIPETTGYCLSHESVPESFGLEPETGSGTRLLFGTGMAQRVTKSDVTRLFSVMKRCLYGYPNLSLDLEAWRKGSLGSVWGFFQERKLKDAFMKTCGEFLPISIGGKPRLFLWEPVLKGAALTDPMPPVAHVPPKEFFRQASRNLLGGLMFVVDSRALMSRELEVTARALRWNLARMGCRLALLPSGASPGSAHARRAWRHPEYRTDPDLRRAAEEEKNEGIRIAGNWVILEGSLEKGDGFRILVGRPISGAFGRPSVWEISSQVGIALWFSIGFVVWGQLVIIGQPISVSSLERVAPGDAAPDVAAHQVAAAQ